MSSAMSSPGKDLDNRLSSIARKATQVQNLLNDMNSEVQQLKNEALTVLWRRHLRRTAKEKPSPTYAELYLERYPEAGLTSTGSSTAASKKRRNHSSISPLMHGYFPPLSPIGAQRSLTKEFDQSASYWLESQDWEKRIGPDLLEGICSGEETSTTEVGTKTLSI